MVTFLLNQDKYTEDIALSWEKQVFEKVIDDYNRGNLTNDQNITLFNNITVTYMAQRSITDELVDQTKYLLYQVTRLIYYYYCSSDLTQLLLSSVIRSCFYTSQWSWEASLIKSTLGMSLLLNMISSPLL